MFVHWYDIPFPLRVVYGVIGGVVLFYHLAFAMHTHRDHPSFMIGIIRTEHHLARQHEFVFLQHIPRNMQDAVGSTGIDHHPHCRQHIVDDLFHMVHFVVDTQICIVKVRFCHMFCIFCHVGEVEIGIQTDDSQYQQRGNEKSDDVISFPIFHVQI